MWAVANGVVGSRDNGRYLLVSFEFGRGVMGCKAVAEGSLEVLVDGIFLVSDDPLHAKRKEDASPLGSSLGSTEALPSTSHGSSTKDTLMKPGSGSMVLIQELSATISASVQLVACPFSIFRMVFGVSTNSLSSGCPGIFTTK